jgi:hypothetical protein
VRGSRRLADHVSWTQFHPSSDRPAVQSWSATPHISLRRAPAQAVSWAFVPTGQQGVKRSYYDRVEGSSYLSAGADNCRSWCVRRRPVRAHAGHAEVGAVAQHGEQDAAEPVSHGYHRGLVTAPRADLAGGVPGTCEAADLGEERQRSKVHLKRVTKLKRPAISGKRSWLLERGGSKTHELRPFTSLAQLLAILGKRDEARSRLSEIYGWFTEGLQDGRSERRQGAPR